MASNLLDVDQLFTDSSLDQFQLSESQRNIFSKFREVNNDWGKYLVFFNVVILALVSVLFYRKSTRLNVFEYVVHYSYIQGMLSLMATVLVFVNLIGSPAVTYGMSLLVSFLGIGYQTMSLTAFNRKQGMDSQIISFMAVLISMILYSVLVGLVSLLIFWDRLIVFAQS